jgi:hypothetical protein
MISCDQIDAAVFGTRPEPATPLIKVHCSMLSKLLREPIDKLE